MKKIILSIIALLSVTVMEAQKNQTHLTLNNGIAIPQFGLGVYSIPAGEVTYNSVLTALKAGYRHINAPIEVYDRIYYRYADPYYSITEMPLTIDDCKLIKKAITLIDNNNNGGNKETARVLKKVQNRLLSILNFV